MNIWIGVIFMLIGAFGLGRGILITSQYPDKGFILSMLGLWILLVGLGIATN